MRTDRLIRRVGGVEVPAAGCWTIPRSHASVNYGARTGFVRRVQGRAAAAAGALHVGDDPTQTELVLHVAAWAGTGTPGAPSLSELLGNKCVCAVTLRASSMEQPTDNTWRMRGVAHSSWVSRPAPISVEYHGVYRAGDGAKAWLTVRADISHDFAGLRPRGPLEIVADVLAVAPRRAVSESTLSAVQAA
jgi:hypothetical protein